MVVLGGGGSPRAELGISLRRAAELVGVCRPTLARYEINPLAVGAPVRARCDAFYRDLRKLLERAESRADR